MAKTSAFLTYTVLIAQAGDRFTVKKMAPIFIDELKADVNPSI